MQTRAKKIMIFLLIIVFALLVLKYCASRPGNTWWNRDACLDQDGCWDSTDKVCRGARDQTQYENDQELCDRDSKKACEEVGKNWRGESRTCEK
jgi:hypothetical protein